MEFGIAVEEDPVRRVRGQNRLQALEHLAGLFTVGSGTDAQVMTRAGDHEFLEENGAHRPIVMSASVDNPMSPLFGAGTSRERPANHRQLNKLGASSYDRADSHALS